jgi:O-6-methylguanine DNA methyltransferase
VGTANGMNRIAIVIPCHRVVNADGRLGGYGGGVWRKQALLDLERGRGSLVVEANALRA